MTEQYLQGNINKPAAPRSVAVTVAEPKVHMTSDDGLVAVDTDLVAGTAVLPLASGIPGRSITVINTGAAPMGLSLATLAGDALAQPAAASALNPIAATDGSLTAVSDGVTTWTVINAQA